MSVDADQASTSKSQSCTLYITTNKRGVQYFTKNFDTSTNGLFVAKGSMEVICIQLKIYLGLHNNSISIFRYGKVVFLSESNSPPNAVHNKITRWLRENYPSAFLSISDMNI